MKLIQAFLTAVVWCALGWSSNTCAAESETLRLNIGFDGKIMIMAGPEVLEIGMDGAWCEYFLQGSPEVYTPEHADADKVLVYREYGLNVFEKRVPEYSKDRTASGRMTTTYRFFVSDGQVTRTVAPAREITNTVARLRINQASTYVTADVTPMDFMRMVPGFPSRAIVDEGQVDYDSFGNIRSVYTSIPGEEYIPQPGQVCRSIQYERRGSKMEAYFSDGKLKYIDITRK